MTILELNNLSKIYGNGASRTIALNQVNLQVKAGEFISIMGPSGSGKSTLLNIIGCMDSETDGTYLLQGKPVKTMGNKEISEVRNRVISFVFQHFALLKNYSVYENVELPLIHRHLHGKAKKEKIFSQLEKLGIQHLHNKLPTQLSGGQQQRVAIARALVSEAELILADEPTGSLDRKTGNELMELLSDINIREGKTILIVTHDPHVAGYTRRRVSIEDGEIKEDVLLR